MATLHQQATVAAHEGFVARVRMAMLTHAQYRVANPEPDGELAALGRDIIRNPIGYAETFARVVATSSFVQQGIGTAPVDGEDVDDAALLSAVETVFPSFVR